MVKQEKARIIALAAFLALTVFPVGAQERPIEQGSLDVFLGGYVMNEPRFDAVYPKGGLLAGLGASARIISNLNLYLEAKYWEREGELTFSRESTTFRLFPISLGVRYILPLGVFNPYAGAGGDIYFYYEDNAIGTTINSASGYHATAGTYLRLSRNVPLMLNLKAKYTWVDTAEGDFEIKLGGFEYAVGLALAF